jgi:hypothetical protein
VLQGHRQQVPSHPCSRARTLCPNICAKNWTGLGQGVRASGAGVAGASSPSPFLPAPQPKLPSKYRSAIPFSPLPPSRRPLSTYLSKNWSGFGQRVRMSSGLGIRRYRGIISTPLLAPAPKPDPPVQISAQQNGQDWTRGSGLGSRGCRGIVSKTFLAQTPGKISVCLDRIGTGGRAWGAGVTGASSASPFSPLPPSQNPLYRGYRGIVSKSLLAPAPQPEPPVQIFVQQIGQDLDTGFGLGEQGLQRHRQQVTCSSCLIVQTPCPNIYPKKR